MVDEVLSQVISITGGLSDAAVRRFEDSFTKTINDQVWYAFTECVRCPNPMKKHLAMADEVLGKAVSITGGLSEAAVSKLEKGLIRAFDNVMKEAWTYDVGSDTQKEFFDVADKIQERLVSLTGSLSEAVLKGIETSLVRIFNSTVRDAYNDNSLAYTENQREFLASADGIQSKLALMTDGLNEQAASEMKSCLAEAFDKVRQRADSCARASPDRKKFLAMTRAITVRQEYIDQLTKGYNPWITTRPLKHQLPKRPPLVILP